MPPPRPAALPPMLPLPFRVTVLPTLKFAMLPPKKEAVFPLMLLSFRVSVPLLQIPRRPTS